MEELGKRSLEEVHGGLRPVFTAILSGFGAGLAKIGVDTIYELINNSGDKKDKRDPMQECFNPCFTSAEQMGCDTDEAATTCFNNCSVIVGSFDENK